MITPDQVFLIRATMLRLWGLPYRWGGNNPVDGFDCSGAVLEILTSLDLWPAKVDANAAAIFAHFSAPAEGETLSLKEVPTVGTLVFYGGDVGRITHVGIAYDGRTLFEFGGGDRTTVDRATAAKQGAFGRFRPIDHRLDLVAFVRPLALAPG